MSHFSGSKTIPALMILVFLLSGAVFGQNSQPKPKKPTAAEASAAIMQQQIDFQSFEIEQLKRDLLQEREVVELLIRQLKAGRPDNESEGADQGDQDPPCAMGEPTVLLTHQQGKGNPAIHAIYARPELRDHSLGEAPQ